MAFDLVGCAGVTGGLVAGAEVAFDLVGCAGVTGGLVTDAGVFVGATASGSAFAVGAAGCWTIAAGAFVGATIVTWAGTGLVTAEGAFVTTGISGHYDKVS